MPGIGSTRMGTRWPSSRRLSLAVAAGAALALGACVHSVAKYYTPSEGESRMTATDLRDQADQLLSVECQRLLKSDSAANGAAQYLVEVDRGGAVSRAELKRSSGDAKIDDIFGAMAARLQFEPPQNMKKDHDDARVEIGYDCAPNVAVSTFRVIE